MHDTATDKPTLSLSQFRTLQELIRARSGICFHEAKKYLLESRLRPRLTELGVATFEEYLALLSAVAGGEDEFHAMCDRITINETSFFRDPEQFDHFERCLLPHLLQRRAGERRLRLWSAACSSGEEPYTFAILLHRLLGVRLADWRIEILGTDLSARMLAFAREGVFTDDTLRGASDLVRQRYFAEAGERFRLDPQIASMVHFQEHNLLDRAGAADFGSFDVICCRNVLIYFDEEMKQRSLGLFEEHLAADGCLLIGHSETLHGLSTPLTEIHTPQAHCWCWPETLAAGLCA